MVAFFKNICCIIMECLVMEVSLQSKQKGLNQSKTKTKQSVNTAEIYTS